MSRTTSVTVSIADFRRIGQECKGEIVTRRKGFFRSHVVGIAEEKAVAYDAYMPSFRLEQVRKRKEAMKLLVGAIQRECGDGYADTARSILRRFDRIDRSFDGSAVRRILDLLPAVETGVSENLVNPPTPPKNDNPVEPKDGPVTPISSSVTPMGISLVNTGYGTVIRKKVDKLLPECTACDPEQRNEISQQIQRIIERYPGKVEVFDIKEFLEKLLRPYQSYLVMKLSAPIAWKHLETELEILYRRVDDMAMDRWYPKYGHEMVDILELNRFRGLSRMKMDCVRENLRYALNPAGLEVDDVHFRDHSLYAVVAWCLWQNSGYEASAKVRGDLDDFLENALSSLQFHPETYHMLQNFQWNLSELENFQQDMDRLKRKFRKIHLNGDILNPLDRGQEMLIPLLSHIYRRPIRMLNYSISQNETLYTTFSCDRDLETGHKLTTPPLYVAIGLVIPLIFSVRDVRFSESSIAESSGEVVGNEAEKMVKRSRHPNAQRRVMFREGTDFPERPSGVPRQTW